VTKTIKATLRNENGLFEADIELIGWEEAPLELTLNLENFAPTYNLECADIGQGRAHYEKKPEKQSNDIHPFC
jgi:hypothetical protein